MVKTLVMDLQVMGVTRPIHLEAALYSHPSRVRWRPTGQHALHIGMASAGLWGFICLSELVGSPLQSTLQMFIGRKEKPENLLSQRGVH